MALSTKLKPSFITQACDMDALARWQQQISQWYDTQSQSADHPDSRMHDQVEALIPLIMHPPESLWGPDATPEQGRALACWLDGCLRIYQSYLDEGRDMSAYQYLNFGYAKMQAIASDAMTDRVIKLWAIERLDHLIVLVLELCSRCHWLSECETQVEGHIHFMAALHSVELEEFRNDDQGISDF
ncbi:transcriptional regulator [Vibrio sp. SCSIO 43136]|uniref:transcriptional regulator n=1 Tax=Vibrio sp. SCSIO 43136 TaxID=2819101 RepID=UPI0020757292|nr:transcriptional regulator [Vibrio sp. SCSIO 43136]USD67493.1 transcriptional regulator [Vibrio sp. SCSIO 43136]